DYQEILARTRPPEGRWPSRSVAGNCLVLRIAHHVPNFILRNSVFDNDVDVVTIGIVLEIPDDQRLERLRHGKLQVGLGPCWPSLELYYKKRRYYSPSARADNQPGKRAFTPLANATSSATRPAGFTRYHGRPLCRPGLAESRFARQLLCAS